MITVLFYPSFVVCLLGSSNYSRTGKLCTKTSNVNVMYLRTICYWVSVNRCVHVYCRRTVSALPQKWPFILHVFSSQEHVPYVVCKLPGILCTSQAPITSITAKGYQHFLTKLLTIPDPTPDSSTFEDGRVLGIRCIAAVVGKIHARKSIWYIQLNKTLLQSRENLAKCCRWSNTRPGCLKKGCHPPINRFPLDRCWQNMLRFPLDIVISYLMDSVIHFLDNLGLLDLFLKMNFL